MAGMMIETVRKPARFTRAITMTVVVERIPGPMPSQSEIPGLFG